MKINAFGRMFTPRASHIANNPPHLFPRAGGGPERDDAKPHWIPAFAGTRHKR